ncbi:lysylphosphatidylglycerol synthase transmembrane domain-containing protein [Pedobacter sp. MW01-1-1]|uniref:lysylphosphatidylglycerol synthase transmembrane domain-containing protein n=1 Tax=Pedobacter sp. MW01-1-1 TaxID=3383027 RepID=UPI003FEE77EE
MAHKLKAIIKYLILLVIGVGLLYFAFKGQNISKIWQEIKTAKFLWIFISASTVLLAHIVRARRWQMLYQSIQYNVHFWNAYHAVIIGYLANLALPRFGEIARCSVIYKTQKVPMLSSIGTVITDRLFDVIVLLLMGLGMLLFQYPVVAHFLYQTIYVNLSQKFAAINILWIIFLLIAGIALITVAIYFLRKFFNKKFLKILVSLRQGFSSYTKLKNKGLFLFYTTAIWFLYYISMYFAFSAISSTTHLGLDAAYTAFVFSGFAMVAPIQGGIGVFHWMVAQALVLYAVNFKDALAYATIIHSMQILLVLLLGCISMLCVLLKKTNTAFSEKQ